MTRRAAIPAQPGSPALTGSSPALQGGRHTALAPYISFAKPQDKRSVSAPFPCLPISIRSNNHSRPASVHKPSRMERKLWRPLHRGRIPSMNESLADDRLPTLSGDGPQQRTPSANG